MIEKLTKLFPLWAVLFSLLAYYVPSLFNTMSSAIVPLLVVVMFGMGMTLTWENFKDVLKTPRIIFFGILLQYLVMPLSAYIISKAFGLPAELMAGMVLVGSSPGGTASNVITYLAEGNVALSITLTLSSTLIAVILTPSISLLYLNHVVAVPFWNMFLSISEMVLLPVLAGTAINTIYGNKLEKIRPLFPFISTIAIVLIIAIIVALNRMKLAGVDLTIIFAVMLHNISGLSAGYGFTKLLKYDEKTARTLSIEVGMQNSGLAVALAVKYFSSIAALPGAIFSIWHNLSGSLLAGYWRVKGVKNNKKF